MKRRGSKTYGGIHKWGCPKNRWFIMDKLIKMDDLGLPPFYKTLISW
jgi:hypothetical protein